MRGYKRIVAGAVLGAVPEIAAAQGPGLIPSLERLAVAGNAEAIYHLGMAYQTGSGVKEDPVRAFEAFTKGAALGDPLASYKLGCYYLGQGPGVIKLNPEKGLKYKLVAANAGYALAQQDVALLYARSGDMSSSLAWLEKSAAQGWPASLMALSSIYNGSSGVERDPAKMAAYFRLFVERSKPTVDQIEWLRSFENHLSSSEKKRAEQIVSEYRALPTQLTTKALFGQRSAYALIEKSLLN